MSGQRAAAVAGARRAGVAAAYLLLSACSPPRLLWSERRAAQAYHDARLRVAARRYADLVHAAPRNALFWARLGNCEALLKDTQAAAKAYTRALALRPNLMMVPYNLARVRLHEAYAILSNIGRRPKSETDLGARARALRHGIAALLAARGLGQSTKSVTGRRSPPVVSIIRRGKDPS